MYDKRSKASSSHLGKKLALILYNRARCPMEEGLAYSTLFLG